jgi:hypothetical protein
MDFSAKILGRSVVAYLVERHDAAVLQIGRDRFARADLASVACFNFTAAANLSRHLQSLGVRDTRDVFEHVHPDRLAIPHLGAVSLAVLGAAFESKGLGAPAPLETWFQKHRGAPVTFATLKAHELEKKPARPARRTR